MKKNKTWKKPDQILSLGECRYCNKEVTNDMSFVSFVNKDKAHYLCMKKDDFKKIIEQNKNKILGASINCNSGSKLEG